MVGLIDMEQKGCESIIRDHDRDIWVTIVGWVDVAYSEWGDLRHRRAIDISSCNSEANGLNVIANLDWSNINPGFHDPSPKGPLLISRFNSLRPSDANMRQ